MVLPIRWPEGKSLHGKANIEGIARTRRFRLLGRACQLRSIGSLLLAHHEDDAVETLMMRLASGASMGGLAAMRSTSNIPQCYDMYGVSNPTVVSSSLGGSQSLGLVQAQEGPGASSAVRYSSVTIPLPIESGGIRIHRPLLSFSKARLQATCRALGIEWVEDVTNSDPTYTARNAVRALLQSNRLPQALRGPSLSAFGKKAIERYTERADWITWVWSLCKILSFDTRVGTLVVQLPSQKSLYNPQSTMCLNRLKAAYLIREILQLLSPYEDIKMRGLDTLIDRIFPHISDQHFREHAPHSSQTEERPTTFTLTAAGVQVTNPNTCEFPPIYIMQRMPFPQSLYPKPIPIHPGQVYQEEPNAAYQMRLWDHRFWLHVKNFTSQVLYIAPLTPSRAKSFRLSLRSDPRCSSMEFTRFERVMKELVDPGVQWTLPAIIRPTRTTATAYQVLHKRVDEHEDSAPASRPDDYGSRSATNASSEHLVPDRASWTTRSEIEALGEVIAIPSLEFVSHSWKDKISWECKYKKVNLGLREVNVRKWAIGRTTLNVDTALEARSNARVQGISAALPIWKDHLPVRDETPACAELMQNKPPKGKEDVQTRRVTSRTVPRRQLPSPKDSLTYPTVSEEHGNQKLRTRINSEPKELRAGATYGSTEESSRPMDISSPEKDRSTRKVVRELEPELTSEQTTLNLALRDLEVVPKKAARLKEKLASIEAQLRERRISCKANYSIQDQAVRSSEAASQLQNRESRAQEQSSRLQARGISGLQIRRHIPSKGEDARELMSSKETSQLENRESRAQEQHFRVWTRVASALRVRRYYAIYP